MEIGCFCFIFYTSKQLRPRRLFSNQVLYTTVLKYDNYNYDKHVN